MGVDDPADQLLIKGDLPAGPVMKPNAQHICDGLPVFFHDRDYRKSGGQYDKIVSVGMFEHVGRKNYRTFMQAAHRSLKKEGIFLLHTIGSNVSLANCDPWMNTYYFPQRGIAQSGTDFQSVGTSVCD